MDLASNNILFVMEGKREESVVESMQKVLFDDKTVITCVFGTVVYALYNEIKEDRDLDVFTLLKSRIKELQKFDRNTFSEIYLFFDYDAHASNASNTKLEVLFSTFDNETENGKLYVSYPMLEALKHYTTLQDFKTKIAKCNDQYKKQVNRECDPKYIDFNRYDKEIWGKLSEAHLCKMNYIVTDDYKFPTEYFSQSSIFEKQKEKYKVPNEVGVLSAFPVFLYDEFGREKLLRKLK